MKQTRRDFLKLTGKIIAMTTATAVVGPCALQPVAAKTKLPNKVCYGHPNWLKYEHKHLTKDKVKSSDYYDPKPNLYMGKNFIKQYEKSVLELFTQGSTVIKI